MFCRIYVAGNKITQQFLLFQLCELLKEKPINNSYIENSFFSISIDKNDEYDKIKASAFPDGFIYFPLSIEINFNIEDEEEAVITVNTILKFLWNNGYPAIAASSFEDMLYEKGGYKSKNVPHFPKPQE